MCNKANSDTTKSCPHCGFKVKKDSKIYKLIVPITIIGVFALVFFILYLVSTTGKPSDMSQEVYNYGIDAISVADKYLDEIYNYDTTDSKLDEISQKIKSIGDTDSVIISSSVVILSSTMFNGDESKVLEARNNLASELNQKKR